MFCHERYSLLVVFEKKQHDRINTREETMGETRGRREQVIACTLIEYACGATGERWHPSATGVVDGQHRRCVRRSSRPDTSLPHASPYRLPTILLLAFSLSAVPLWQNQKGRRAGIMPCGIPGAERLSAHA